MEQIHAPYNFVPLSNKVVEPSWAAQVSQDLPFKDGISGELSLKITALSPLMVGGEQTAATDSDAGQVRFFKTPMSKTHPQGQYAIPGSSLRGALRNVFEIATFSRMNHIDEKRYGLRDISGSHVADSYKNRIQDNIKYGFLRLGEQGEPVITPCKMAKLDHRRLERELNHPAVVFEAGATVQEKYQIWEKICQDRDQADAYRIPFDIDNKEVATQLLSGQKVGFPVFTGQVTAEEKGHARFGEKYKGRPKYQDYLFYDADETQQFVVSAQDAQAWRNFLFIHGDEVHKKAMPWPSFWKEKFYRKEDVPVFFVKSADRLHIGLACMPKLAGDFSTHDMLLHTHKDHLGSSLLDMTALVFGQVNESDAQTLKGRVSIEPAFLTSQAKLNPHPVDTILNGAKPSYFPNYIYQKTTASGKLANQQYATYVCSESNPAPELRGWKRYPARPNNEVRVQALGGDLKQSKKVQTRLYNLESGARFESRLVFHNLKPVELGALLWSIELENKRHSLGMGKSFGYGQVAVSFEWNTRLIQCNDPKATLEQDYQAYINVFTDYMSEALGTDWRQSTPITALLNMSDTASRGLFQGELRHMHLDKKEFADAKKAGLVLQGYVADERLLKQVSHVSIGEKKVVVSTKPAEYEKTTWLNAGIHFKVGENTLIATSEAKKATLTGSRAKELYDALSKNAQNNARKSKLKRNVDVKSRGNEHIILTLHDAG